MNIFKKSKSIKSEFDRQLKYVVNFVNNYYTSEFLSGARKYPIEVWQLNDDGIFIMNVHLPSGFNKQFAGVGDENVTKAYKDHFKFSYTTFQNGELIDNYGIFDLKSVFEVSEFMAKFNGGVNEIMNNSKEYFIGNFTI